MRTVRWTLLGLASLVACGGDDAGKAQVTAHIINGASPGALQTLTTPPPLADGNWQVSPTKIRAPLVALQFSGMAGGTVDVPLTDCTVTFDLTKPGLAEDLPCTFTLPADTYTRVGAVWGPTYELLIDDRVNGMFTDPSAPSKLVTTMPAAGAQPVTVPNPRANMGGGTQLPVPLVVHDGDQVSLSVLLSALQSIQASASNGNAALGVDGNGQPGFPDAVFATGEPAAIAYYVNPVLGTAYSYRASAIGSQGPFAVSVLYSNASRPAFLGMTTGNQITGCGPIQIGFVFPGKGNGYLGLDSTSTLGWATFSDVASTHYSALLRMMQVSTLGATTQLQCQNTTTDPMPPGDSFDSGAPVLASPTYTTTMTLVAK